MSDDGPLEPVPATGFDALLGGRLLLRQPRRGHRAGTDAVLLASAANAQPGDHFIDIGAGVGTVGLSIAIAQQDATGLLIELDAGIADLARANVAANGVDDRVAVVTVDLFDQSACSSLNLMRSASLVVTNPPYFLAGDVRPSPDRLKAAAYVLQTPEGVLGHGSWIERCLALLRPRGRLLLIHRPEALPDLIQACHPRLGSLMLRTIHAREGGPATRILFGGTLEGRASMVVLPPLMLHDGRGGFTHEAAALHAGEAMAFWPQKSRLK